MKRLTKALIFMTALLPIVATAQYTAASRMLSSGKEVIITNWIRGTVELNSGLKREGEIQLKVVETDTVEIRFRKKGEKKAKYTRAEVSRFKGVLLIGDVKSDYKDESKNFHPGYMLLQNGERWDGKVAARIKEPHESQYKNHGPIAVKFANENGEVSFWWAKAKEVEYYVQVVNGQENHYVAVFDNYLKVGNPTGRFSYFRNTRPTHIREGMTNMAKGAAQSVTDEIAKSVAEAAAKKSMEASLAQGKSLGEAMGNAVVAATNTAGAIQDAVEVDDAGGIYFREFYIVDNKKQTRTIVYKKNIDEVLNTLLEGCGLEEKIVNKVGKIKELEEVMIFLEQNACD